VAFCGWAQSINGWLIDWRFISRTVFARFVGAWHDALFIVLEAIALKNYLNPRKTDRDTGGLPIV
jgi:hypothetical protein